MQSLLCFQWISEYFNISEEDSGNTIDNIIESIFSDVTQFYIDKHLNTFSKLLLFSIVINK